ncbi:MAG: TolC family protein [Campylobacterales bacterium]
MALQGDILSPLKQESLLLKQQKNELDANFLRDSWLSPVVVQGGWQQSESRLSTAQSERESLSATVSISQDIFRSGGILQARRYAQESRLAGRGALEKERRGLIQEAIATLYAVRKLRWQIQKQERLVENAQIDIARKREQYEKGVLDSSFLDNALLDYSAKSAALLELKMGLAEREAHFQTLSDHDPLTYEAPRFELVDPARFESANLALWHQERLTGQQNAYRRMIAAKYLPRVALNASYQHYFSDEVAPAGSEVERVSAYGVTLSVPLDFNGRRETQSAQIAYRLTRQTLEESRVRERTFYAALLKRLAQIDDQIALARSDVAVYDSLVKQVGDQLKAGQKTRDDLKIMQNAKAARELDLKIYDANRQIELLSLHARLMDDPL